MIMLEEIIAFDLQFTKFLRFYCQGLHKVACAFMGFGVSAAVLPLRIPQNRKFPPSGVRFSRWKGVRGMALFPF
jgi:hypothetical protein